MLTNELLALVCSISSIHSRIRLADRPSADDVVAFEYCPQAQTQEINPAD